MNSFGIAPPNIRFSKTNPSPDRPGTTLSLT